MIHKLIKEAFSLTYRIRTERWEPGIPSVRRERLHALMLRSYARFERRLDIKYARSL